MLRERQAGRQTDRDTQTETHTDRWEENIQRAKGAWSAQHDNDDGCLEENYDEGHKLNYDVDMITDYIIM